MTVPSLLSSAGAQYAAVSPCSAQFVPPASIPVYVENAFVVSLPKKSCRCEAPGCFGYTIGSSGARWLGRQSVKKVWPPACADGTTSMMSSAPRMMTSHDLRMVSPLSVHDPARPSGLPLPPLSAHLAVDLESERGDLSQDLTGTRSRRDHDGVGTSWIAIGSGGKPEHRADATGPVVGSEPRRAPPGSPAVHMPCTGCTHRCNRARSVDGAHPQAGNDPGRLARG